jgi:hypothetical protein
MHAEQNIKKFSQVGPLSLINLKSDFVKRLVPKKHCASDLSLAQVKLNHCLGVLKWKSNFERGSILKSDFIFEIRLCLKQSPEKTLCHLKPCLRQSKSLFPIHIFLNNCVILSMLIERIQVFTYLRSQANRCLLAANGCLLGATTLGRMKRKWRGSGKRRGWWEEGAGSNLFVQLPNTISKPF